MRVLFSISFLFCFFNIDAQIHNPVKWTYEARCLKKKGEFELVFKAKIEDDWAIYAQDVDCFDCPTPTTIDFERDFHYELIGDCIAEGDKKTAYDDLSKTNISKYKNTVVFRQKIKVSSSLDTILGFICYSACNNSRCLPARDFNFVIKLPNCNDKKHHGQSSDDISFFKRLFRRNDSY